MMTKPKVLFASSEVYPFAKSGGLADVAYSLPKALNQDYNVDVIMPLYKTIEKKHYKIKKDGEAFEIIIADRSYSVSLYSCTYKGMHYRFVDTDVLCDRDYLYGPPQGGYEDNDIRFALFSFSLFHILKYENYQIVHLNDWQTSLTALLLKDAPDVKTKSIFTIHNLAYQGVFDKTTLQKIGLDESYFHMDALEFYGQVNFMKAGIAYSDKVTTVSPTYANEILTSEELGCGLSGFLQLHKEKLTGMVNGIDEEEFSPSKDRMLVKPYADLRSKAVNKRAYLKEIQLNDAKKPLMIFIGRFTWQKGLDLLINILPKIAKMSCNIAILGEGDRGYHEQLETIAEQFTNVHLTFGYDETLSHRMYAASDFFLMPSLFEPCGLAQMIAMHYGSMPIVHQVGGLNDTVHDVKTFQKKSNNGYGLVFEKPDEALFLDSIEDALHLYNKKPLYNKIVKHNMQCDFSWRESAQMYINKYKELELG